MEVKFAGQNSESGFRGEPFDVGLLVERVVEAADAGPELRVDVHHDGLVQRVGRDQMERRRQVEHVVAVVRALGRPEEPFQRFDFAGHPVQHVPQIVVDQLQNDRSRH